MNKLIKTLELMGGHRLHHRKTPDGIINDFLTSEECLLAQLEWAHKRYMAVIGYREAYERYEKINQQCYGYGYGIRKLMKAFEDVGVDFIEFQTEQEKHFRYWVHYTEYQLAEKAYLDFKSVEKINHSSRDINNPCSLPIFAI